LEQYPTSAQLTASVVFTALQNGDLGPGLTALDLGCGTGMLALGCALVECDHVFAVDCDEEALKIAKGNVIDLELDDSFDFLVAKVACSRVRRQPPNTTIQRQKSGGRHKHSSRGGRSTPRQSEGSASTILTDDDGIPLQDNCVDTVLTNPPFGTKHNAGMDVQFLRTATRLARTSVYSFHKSSTREYLLRTVSEWGMESTVVAQMKFDIPNTYKFHQKKSVDVEVDLLRVSVRQERQDAHDEEETTIQHENELFDDGEEP
jgi:putative methylase